MWLIYGIFMRLLLNVWLSFVRFSLVISRHTELIFKPFHFSLQVINSDIELSYDPFRKMWSLGQLIFNFLMNLKLLLHWGYLLLKLFILKDEFFCLFGLVFKLWSELMVLKHSQPRSSFKLFSFERYEILFHIFDLVVHFILDFISSLNLLPFLVCNFPQLVSFFHFDSLPKLLSLLFKLISLAHIQLILWELTFIFSQLKVIIFLSLFRVFQPSLLLFIFDYIKNYIYSFPKFWSYFISVHCLFQV